MSDDLISAAGERAAIGGYVPQFNEFARFAYRELTNNNLEWIKIADPDAEKLDDIQYSTSNEVHAYQVKWTIADANISFSNFLALLPSIVASWRSLRGIHKKEGKKVIAHLLTNKRLSKGDSIKDGERKIGSFTDFYDEVWMKWKAGDDTGEKWNFAIKMLVDASDLPKSEFLDFVSFFEFHPGHIGKDLKISLRSASTEVEDLLTFRSFLLENVADPERRVEFSAQEIIDRLGWRERFKTTFNHELFVDKKRYQSISSTIRDLDTNLSDHSGGYLFLIGGPGTGKSTLITEWLKSRRERVVKYYAFDFTNPSSFRNFSERGDATTLYFDLVHQLKQIGIYNRNVVPIRDLIFLKSAFQDQLAFLGQEFEQYGTKTIIAIDGLDHVPREYKSVTNSFLRELPLPVEIPQGVYLVLGSQSYELEELSHEIKLLWRNGERVITMQPFERKDVIQYIDLSQLHPPLSELQKQVLYEKSQGHPLYLAYLVGRLAESANRDDILNSVIVIDGDIDIYYRKVWEPIANNVDLLDFLGLIARINETINVAFVTEWGFPKKALLDFKRYAKLLFDENKEEWNFFHNSFRQFIQLETARNPLTDIVERSQDIAFHKRLAIYYSVSLVEPKWKQNIHLYNSAAYEDFLKATSALIFFDQLLRFRPPSEIRQDILLGIDIGLKKDSPTILLTYQFALAELERRLHNLDPSSFVNELLQLNRAREARSYVRNGTTLLVGHLDALKIARAFYFYGDKREAAYLFSLSEPDIVTVQGIILDYDKHIDNTTIRILQEWVRTALLFEHEELIAFKIQSLKAISRTDTHLLVISPETVKSVLLRELTFGLINQEKWNALDLIISSIDPSSELEKSNSLYAIQHAVQTCFEKENLEKARYYLAILLDKFSPNDCEKAERIYIADLILKVAGNRALTYQWLEGIGQPLVTSSDPLDSQTSFDSFIPLIKYNKILNLTGEPASLTTAVPAAKRNSDEEVIVEFQRMICLITQIYCDGVEDRPIFNLETRIKPVVQFYNRIVSHRNLYWYPLTRMKNDYFDFLIEAVASSNRSLLGRVAKSLSLDFEENSQFWTSQERRSAIDSLAKYRLSKATVTTLLESLELEMLQGKEISTRIDECLLQAKSYLDLGEKEKCEKFIKRGIEESIGVGYRKDYQFSSWLTWLNKIIVAQPSNAQKHILWFLSHLRHLKDTTEGSAFRSAARKILSITMDWNFKAGFQQLTWQLESGLIGFESALGTFIECFLSRSTKSSEYEAIFLLYSEIYLYIATDTDTDLLEQLLTSGVMIYGDSFLAQYVPRIYEAITSRALDESRPHLLETFEEFIGGRQSSAKEFIPDFAIPLTPEHHRSTRSQNMLVLISEDQNISESEVLIRITNYAELKYLVEQEDTLNSYFKWEGVYRNFRLNLTIYQVSELGEICITKSRQVDLLVCLAERASELKSIFIASRLAEAAISKSSEMGWLTYYDGGSRIKAFGTLQKVIGDEGRKKAMEVYSHDLVNSQSAASFAENLDNILPVIAPQLGVDQIWSVLFEYLKRLMSTSPPTEDLPELEKSEDTILSTIINFWRYLVKYDVSIIRAAAVRALAIQVVNRIAFAIETIALMEIQTDNDAELFMDILLSVHSAGGSVEPFTSKLQALAISKNFMVRSEAEYLLEKLNMDVPQVSKRQLPPVYNLNLNIDENIDERLIFSQSQQPLITIEKMISPFDKEVRILAQMSSINKNTLLYRIQTFMKEESGTNDWLQKSDGPFRKHLEDIDLKYSYPKPCLVRVRHALFRLISELIDSGIINTKQGKQLAGCRDKNPSFFKISTRPSFVPPLNEKTSIFTSSSWTESIHDDPRLKEPLIKFGPWNVIGEYSHVKNLNWETPQQIYMSQIKASNLESINWLIFGNAYNKSSKDYGNLTAVGDEIIIARDNNFGDIGLQSMWLAINPNLARTLDWQLREDKLFTWVDKSGDLMAESIYWRDGNIHMLPPHLYSEAGEGWYVIISDKAMNSIKNVLPSLYIEKLLHRTVKEDDSNTYSTIEPLLTNI